MTIHLTLEEVCRKCTDWHEVCRIKGYTSLFCITSALDTEIILTEEEAVKFGIIKMTP